MLRIKIDNDLIAFAENFCKNLFKSRDSKFIAPVKKLEKLAIDPSLCDYQRAIVRYCKINYLELLLLKPKAQQQLVSYIDNTPGLQTVFYDVNNNATSFSKILFDAFRYDALRETEAYKIVERLGTNTCAYCNSQLAIVITKGVEKRAKLEFDHFFPSSKYPFLSTSFFNLIPCCSNCNKAKLNSQFQLDRHFHLYTEDSLLNPFLFSISNESILQYRINNNLSELELDFDAVSPNIDYKIHNDVFAIKPIYETQKDIIEELLFKQMIYSKSYKKELKRIVGLFKGKNKEQLIQRLILGNYSLVEDIHKRPLAKFTQDIAKQLKLLR